ncbi:MAG: hypothetical protein ACO2PK_10025 [Armatimonadota bacterium]|jgi:hypothetical protein
MLSVQWLASPSALFPLLQRKVKTAAKVFRNGGLRKLFEVFWLKLR